MAHLTSDQINRYLERSLSPADIGALQAHVAGCEDCRLTLEQASGERFENTPVSGPHLHADEMADGKTQPPVPQSSGAKWLYMVAGIAAVILVAIAFQYVPHNRTLSTASLRDSGLPIELDADGAVQGLNEASGIERDQVSVVLRDRALPAAPKSANATPAVRSPDSGTPAPFGPIAPLNARVLSNRPMFSWTALPGATAYEVTVSNQSLIPLARSGPVTAAEWQTPTALPRGENLFWQIRATRGNETVSAPASPAPPTRFDIASAETAYRIGQLRASHHPSHLLMAVIFNREGMYADAAAELRSLAKENPGSTLVQSLQKSLSVQNAGRK